MRLSTIGIQRVRDESDDPENTCQGYSEFTHLAQDEELVHIFKRPSAVLFGRPQREQISSSRLFNKFLGEFDFLVIHIENKLAWHPFDEVLYFFQKNFLLRGHKHLKHDSSFSTSWRWDNYTPGLLAAIDIGAQVIVLQVS